MENRKSQRLKIPLRIDYNLFPRGSALEKTFAHNISGSGICLKLDYSLHKGDKLKTIVHFPQERRPVVAISRVIWCMPVTAKKKAFYIGMKYIKIMREDRERFVFLFCEMMLNYFFMNQRGKRKLNNA